MKSLQNSAPVSAISNIPQVNHKATGRLFYMDNLRCLAMLAGIILHVGLAYAQNISAVWYVDDSQSSGAIEVGTWFIHLFRMALFFFVAGFFANMIIKKKGTSYFVKSRLSRVIIPFVVFMPLVVLAINSVVFFALDYLSSEQPTLHMVSEKLSKTSLDIEHFRTYHLWFIYYLALFCALAVFVQDTKSALLSKLIEKVCSSRYSPFVLALCIFPSHFTQSLPMAAPESLIPELWVFGYYGLFFVYGWQFFKNQVALTFVSKHKSVLLFLCLASYAVIYQYIPNFNETDIPLTTMEHFFVAVLESFSAVFLVLLSIYFAQRFLSKQNRVFAYFSKTSYWVYLVHLPIAIFVQVILAEIDMNVWFKYFLAIFGTLGLSLLSFEILRGRGLVTSVITQKVARRKRINSGVEAATTAQ